MLNKRKLGNEGLVVSEIGLGCMGMSQFYGESDEQESIATLLSAVDLGVTYFDTAENYGPFLNEELLGKAFKGVREKVTIGTKFGFLFQDGKVTGVNSKPAHIRNVVEGSLKRLGTDYIDVLYQHRVDPEVPIEDVIGEMGRLVKEGKVKYLGLCEAGVSIIKRAHAVHPLSVIQSEYSIWERNLDENIRPLLESLNIGLVTFCPLGRGFLTGKVKPAEDYGSDDFRSLDPRFKYENFEHNHKITSTVTEIANSIGVSASQLCLSWILSQSDNIVPIPGTKRKKYLEENVAASRVVLPDHIKTELDNLLQNLSVAGPRYENKMMALINR
ncbi:aldo/keto reductase [Brenneria izbisi]|uniref:Aldo/keto reductase n=1 Tax=Brenneria izbisi TaxID=2939450 RepID=A0AA41XTM5_9GAMM|nr:aldo/keto reductase [Brenneria izbisi]MCV9877503.1 aldo/keto reductase [Brenneria izbisi]MCV9880931.1 aldo/keto reductase [Brenneria izbisi]